MGKLIEMSAGDGIQIDGDVRYLYQKCCDCGSRHLVTVEWIYVNKERDSVVLRWYPIEPEEEG